MADMGMKLVPSLGVSVGGNTWAYRAGLEYSDDSGTGSGPYLFTERGSVAAAKVGANYDAVGAGLVLRQGSPYGGQVGPYLEGLRGPGYQAVDVGVSVTEGLRSQGARLEFRVGLRSTSVDAIDQQIRQSGGEPSTINELHGTAMFRF